MRDTLMMNKNTDEEAQKILDAVGDGLAQEETAQEILESIEKTRARGYALGEGNIINAFVNTPSGEITLADITGEGSLLSLYVYSYSTKNSTITMLVQIEVDDKIYTVNVSQTQSSTSGTYTVSIRKPLPDGIGSFGKIADNGFLFLYSGDGSSYTIDADNNTMLIPVEGETVSVSASNTHMQRTLADLGLFNFTKKLKITVTITNGSSSKCFANAIIKY